MPVSKIDEIIQVYPKITPNGAGEIIFREEKNLGQPKILKKVIITHAIPDVKLAFKLDYYFPVSKYFRAKGTSVNKGCDGVIFVENELDNFVVLIELKSYSVKEKDVANKFFCSSAFLKHINALIHNVHGLSISDFNMAAVIFFLKPPVKLAKFGIRPGPSLEINHEKYRNGINSLSVLEISEKRKTMIHIGLSEIIANIRSKKFKNWP